MYVCVKCIAFSVTWKNVAAFKQKPKPLYTKPVNLWIQILMNIQFPKKITSALYYYVYLPS